MAGPLGREAGHLPSIDSKRKISSSEAGKARLSELRKRMELESKRVIRYLDNQKQSRKKLKPFIPDGWIDWWRMVNLEVERLSKKRRVQQAGKARKVFDERILLNQPLVVWRGCWNSARSTDLL